MFTDKISCVAGDCSVCKIGKDLIKIRVIRMHQNISILKKNFFSQNYRIPHLGNYLNLQQIFFLDLHFLFKIKLAVLRVQTL